MKKITTVLAALLLCFALNAQEGWSEYIVPKDTLRGIDSYTEYHYKGEGFTFIYWYKYALTTDFYTYEIDLEREPYITPDYFGNSVCECYIGAYDPEGNFLDGGKINLVAHGRTNNVLFDPSKSKITDERATYYVKLLLEGNKLRFFIPLAGTKENLNIWISPKQ